jgi:serine/threonine-protein kinase
MRVPYILDNYHLLEKLGEGGVGEVFRGTDLILEREVAIKLLRPELSCRHDIAERFRAEAKTLAKLNHPNIATLYSFGEQGDRVFMVMEFVRGQTCESFISSATPMPWEQATAILCQALHGVAHAHSLGIIHRDLKPANLMVTDTGLVKVMDFGIARLLGAPRATRVGHFVGTPQYTAPELFRGQEANAGTDIYALGIVLYELLTGHLPFSYDGTYDLMTAHIEEMPTLPPHLVEHVPAEVASALMRALAKSPGDRFQTAEEFRLALDHGQQVVALSLSAPESALSLVPADENALVSAHRVLDEGEVKFHDTRPAYVPNPKDTSQKRNPRTMVMLALVGIVVAFFLLRQTKHPLLIVSASTLFPTPAGERPAVQPRVEFLPTPLLASAPVSVVWSLSSPTPPLVLSNERSAYMLESVGMGVVTPPPAKVKAQVSRRTRKDATIKAKRSIPQKKSTKQKTSSQEAWVFKK